MRILMCWMAATALLLILVSVVADEDGWAVADSKLEESSIITFSNDSSSELFDTSEEATLPTSLTSSTANPTSRPTDVTVMTTMTKAAWPWMIFVLTGNSTVASRRQRDLGTYLRLNLAARLDADYNDVLINRILVTAGSVLANLSVDPSHLEFGSTGAAGLEALGQGNVTLLELSGHEFQVEKIIRSDDPLVDQRVSLEMTSMMTGSPSPSEVSVYGAVGAVFLFLMVALLLGLSFNSPCKAGNHPDSKAVYLSSPGRAFNRRDQMDEGTELRCIFNNSSSAGVISIAPPVIYTEELARQSGSTGVLPIARYIPNTITVLTAELHQESS